MAVLTRSTPRQLHRREGDHVLVALVPDPVPHPQHAAVGLGGGGLLVDHLELAVERVAGPHRLEPAQLVEAGRAHAAGAEDAGLENHAESERQRLETAGDEPAVVARFRRLDVDVERLRVVAHGEIDDQALRERDARRHHALAALEIVEVAVRHRELLQASAAAMASPSSCVLALPPRSGVFGAFGSASTRAIAFSIAAAAALSPRWSSIMAPDQIWPIGFAIFWP